LSAALLCVRDLHAGYGELAVLRGVTLDVHAGETVAILGANGAGKSTLLRAISHVGADVRSGTVTFAGTDITRSNAVDVVTLGLSHVPEGRALFTELSVDDNLRLGAYRRPRTELAASLGDVYERFPALAARRSQIAFSLSGGEQQMLAVARALMARPKLLMLDEPSTGLSPQIVVQIFGVVSELRAQGTALLLVEQNALLALRNADRALVFEHGHVALEGSADALQRDDRVQAVYLGGTVDDA